MPILPRQQTEDTPSTTTPTPPDLPELIPSVRHPTISTLGEFRQQVAARLGGLEGANFIDVSFRILINAHDMSCLGSALESRAVSSKSLATWTCKSEWQVSRPNVESGCGSEMQAVATILTGHCCRQGSCVVLLGKPKGDSIGAPAKPGNEQIDLNDFHKLPYQPLKQIQEWLMRQSAGQ